MIFTGLVLILTPLGIFNEFLPVRSRYLLKARFHPQNKIFETEFYDRFPARRASAAQLPEVGHHHEVRRTFGRPRREAKNRSTLKNRMARFHAPTRLCS